MTDSPMINVLSVFFTVTTVAVILYPIIKLAPSWLEGRVHKQVMFHRNAIEALDIALANTQAEPGQLLRLTTQRDYHRDALMTLAPDDTLTAARPHGLTAAA